MPDIQLIANGQRYGGWTECSVTRSMEAAAGTFTLTVTRQPLEDDTPITLWSRCQLKLGGQVVVDGWVEDITQSGDATTCRVEVSGRDKTGDLADCSVVKASGQWKGATLLQIAQEVCQPFGVTVTAPKGTGPVFKDVQVEPGETLLELLRRLAELRALLLMPDASGNLVITPPTTTPPVHTLTIGGDAANVDSYQIPRNTTELFSPIIVKSQVADPKGKASTQIKAQSADARIKRYRPLIVLPDNQTETVNAQTRAAWEASSRWGKAFRPSVTVPGWTDPNGKLWAINTRVVFDAQPFGLRDVFIISSVTFDATGERVRTTLELLPPDAFSQLPVHDPAAESKRSRKGKGKGRGKKKQPKTIEEYFKQRGL